MKAKGDFAEWAKVHDFFYASPRRPLDQCVRDGQDILLDIDVQGARKIKRKYPRPSRSFSYRLHGGSCSEGWLPRGTDRKETIRRRLVNARGEIRKIIKYDYYVVNCEVKTSVELLKSIVEAERAKNFQSQAMAH